MTDNHKTHVELSRKMQDNFEFPPLTKRQQKSLEKLKKLCQPHQPAYRSVITWECGVPSEDGLYLIAAHSATGRMVTDILVWQDNQWWEQDDKYSWAIEGKSDIITERILLYAPLPEPPDMS